MRTPSLRRRVTTSGVIVFALLLLTTNVFVYGALREQLEATLDDVLAARVELARELDELLPPRELAERLQALGVPVIVTTPAGETLVAEPAVPRFQLGPPGSLRDVAHPRISQTVDVTAGGTVEVFATRAGVDGTLRRVLVLMSIGSLGVLGLAMVLFHRSAVVAMAPLEQVIEAADRTAAGYTGERLDPDEPETELGRMAVAYDEMLDALEEGMEKTRLAEEQTRRFLADAAHQLRTPLAAIHASVEVLLWESDPEERDRVMGNLLREAARAARLLHSLLTIARFDQGQSANIRPTDVLAICEDERDRAQSLAPELTVSLRAPARIPSDLLLDEHHLREALANLLDNARRHARERIDVDVAVDTSHIVLQIRDDGPGIPAEWRDLVFQRFTSLDDKGGSGLGLPIARAAARSHGGDLTYEDEAFVLRLPMDRPRFDRARPTDQPTRPTDQPRGH